MKIRLDGTAVSALYWSLEDLMPRRWIELTIEDGKIVAIETNRGKFDMSTHRYMKDEVNTD
jgi:hypothetical protein